MYSNNSRIYAFDWLRITAFGLLIFYHSIQPYNPTYIWHVSDSNSSDQLWTALGWIRHWRLHLLFFVSGFGTYFALRKLGGVSFCKERITRLGIPLLSGMLLICPPQTWIERISQHQYSESYLTFYLTDFFSSGPYPNGNISWTHLWFLPYLLLITLLLSPLLIWLRDSGWFDKNRLSELSQKQIFGLLMSGVVLPMLASTLLLVWPNQTNALIDDWGWFTIWASYFLLGFLVAGFRRELLQPMVRNRWIFLGLTLVCYAILWSNLLKEADVSGQLLLRALAWFLIIALSGFVLRHFNRDSGALRYLNASIFPLYVIHQTITVLVAYLILESGLAVEVKFGIVLISTIVGSLLIYETVIRRIGYAGILFGLKPRLVKQ